MNTILETLNIKGFDVNILADRDAENPLAWGSATLVTAHRRYTFGGDRLPFDANSIEEAFRMVPGTLGNFLCHRLLPWSGSV